MGPASWWTRRAPRESAAQEPKNTAGLRCTSPPHLETNVRGSTPSRDRHQDNQRHPRWTETVRLFTSDDNVAGKGKTQPVKLSISLLDYNKKAEDTLIGEVTVQLQPGAGRTKVEVPSRCVSMARPFVYFRYDATPQMFYEQAEWVRVAADRVEQLQAADAAEATDDAQLPDGEHYAV